MLEEQWRLKQIYNILEQRRQVIITLRQEDILQKEILKDTNLADAYSSLEMIHDRYARVIGNDAIQIRQRLEKMMMADLKEKLKIGTIYIRRYREKKWYT